MKGFLTYRETNLGNTLSDLIRRKQISPPSLADAIGVSRHAIYHYINGARAMDTDTAIKISEYLEVDIHKVIGHRCLICGDQLNTVSFFTDRLGNPTRKRATKDNVHRVYDCQNCGYIQFTEQFMDLIDEELMAEDAEYEVLRTLIEKIREDYHLKWYDIITFEDSSETHDLVDVKFVMTTYKTITKVTLHYSESNRDYDNMDNYDPVPKSYSYKTTLLEDEDNKKTYEPKKVYVDLYETEKSVNAVAHAYFLDDKLHAKTHNEMVVLAGSTLLKKDKLSKKQSIKKRKEVMETAKLIKTTDVSGECYELDQDITFSSPSLAAAVLLGKECSGTRLWKSKEGTSIFELMRTR